MENNKIYLDQVQVKKFKNYHLFNDHFTFHGQAVKETKKAWLFMGHKKEFQWIPKAAMITGVAGVFYGQVKLQDWFKKPVESEKEDPETRYWKNVATCAERFSGDWTD